MGFRTLVFAVWLGIGVFSLHSVPAIGQAGELVIETAAGHADEKAMADKVRQLIDRYELHDWLFTKRMRIDRETRIPHSHPVLTLNTRYMDDDVEALANIIHEQLHWFVLENQGALGAAIADMRQQYPDAPDGPPTGARDLRSTYLHLVVCSLEHLALEEKIGRERAREALSAKPYYTWVFATVLEDEEALRTILEKHSIVLP